jgi:acyl carrier protein
MNSVADTVIAILAEQALLTPADVSRTQSLADLGLDSLGLVEAVFAIEEAFDIQVPFNANEPGRGEFDISTVGAIIDGVQGLVAQKAA